MLAHQTEFMNKYAGFAVQVERETGIPSLAILSQAALESDWGRRVKGNNFLGIKADPSWKGAVREFTTTEVIRGKSIKLVQRFRAYPTAYESFLDYARFIKANSRYATALRQDTAHGYLEQVARAGYATDPLYASKTKSIATSLSAMLSEAKKKLGSA